MPTPVQTFAPIASWVASSNVFNVTFSSINQNYDHLVITCGLTRNLDANAGGRSGQMQWNGITSGYKGQYGIAGGGSTAAGAGMDLGAVSGPNLASGNPNAQGGRPVNEIWIPYYSSTGFQKHASRLANVVDTDANGGGYNIFEDYIIPTTAPLTSLYVYQQVDSFVTGDWITIYGVKNA
jgi:hypothetical protein